MARIVDVEMHAISRAIERTWNTSCFVFCLREHLWCIPPPILLIGRFQVNNERDFELFCFFENLLMTNSLTKCIHAQTASRLRKSITGQTGMTMMVVSRERWLNQELTKTESRSKRCVQSMSERIVVLRTLVCGIDCSDHRRTVGSVVTVSICDLK